MRHCFVAATIGAAFATLYVRTLGSGPRRIVLHGGPDFEISYLLPEMDTLIDGHRLIYYDQRGPGQSAAHVRAEDVTPASDLADIDAIRQHFGQVRHALGAFFANGGS